MAKVATEASSTAAGRPVETMLQAVRRRAEVGDLRRRDAAEKQVAGLPADWRLAFEGPARGRGASAPRRPPPSRSSGGAAVADGRMRGRSWTRCRRCRAWARTRFASTLGGVDLGLLQSGLACRHRSPREPPGSWAAGSAAAPPRSGARTERGRPAALQLPRRARVRRDRAEHRRGAPHLRRVLVLMGRGSRCVDADEAAGCAAPLPAGRATSRPTTRSRSRRARPPPPPRRSGAGMARGAARGRASAAETSRTTSRSACAPRARAAHRPRSTSPTRSSLRHVGPRRSARRPAQRLLAQLVAHALSIHAWPGARTRPRGATAGAHVGARMEQERLRPGRAARRSGRGRATSSRRPEQTGAAHASTRCSGPGPGGRAVKRVLRRRRWVHIDRADSRGRRG